MTFEPPTRAGQLLPHDAPVPVVALDEDEVAVLRAGARRYIDVLEVLGTWTSSQYAKVEVGHVNAAVSSLTTGSTTRVPYDVASAARVACGWVLIAKDKCTPATDTLVVGLPWAVPRELLTWAGHGKAPAGSADPLLATLRRLMGKLEGALMAHSRWGE